MDIIKSNSIYYINITKIYSCIGIIPRNIAKKKNMYLKFKTFQILSIL